MADSVLTVTDDLVVTIAYTLRLEDGELIDSSDDHGPLNYIHGYGNIIPGLEDALTGMAVDDEKEVVVESPDGYGEYDPEAFHWLPLSEFPEEMDLELGLAVELEEEESGEIIEAIITEINDDMVKLDLNHPLAGETLFFEVKVLGLRPATASELDHGHVHNGDHHHG